jgi:hypothetical protein
VRAAAAVVAGAAAAAGAAKLLSQRSSVAAKELYNALAGDAAPEVLLPEKVRIRPTDERCAAVARAH